MVKAKEVHAEYKNIDSIYKRLKGAYYELYAAYPEMSMIKNGCVLTVDEDGWQCIMIEVGETKLQWEYAVSMYNEVAEK